MKEDDLAAVAARTLVDSNHAAHAYVLTGPQSLTQPDKVRIIGKTVGKELVRVEIAPDQLREGMLAQGLSADISERLIGSLAGYAKQAGPSSTGVQEILGRPARAFAEWAADRADAFRDGVTGQGPR